MHCEYLVIEKGGLVGNQNGVLRVSENAVDPFKEAAAVDYPVGYHRGVELRLLLIDSQNESDLLADFGERWGLRRLLAAAEDEEMYSLLSRAAQIATWHNNHRFCSRCATPLTLHDKDLALACGECGLVQYPRISPCIIVLVRNGDRCLLAHAAHFDENRYSTLAGFIEAGETAENAVAREVMEEVGIQVGNVTYHCSQSWPFPHSLMLGFYADYESGEIEPDGVEITDARWFGKEDLAGVNIPPPFTIARKLLDHYWASLDDQGQG
ncbi:NAD(+) diphosphatase [Pontibacterium granulatum]|uniref:NAD(+) diphosphatase n=1 Tax=Pontibacterium granulatum TaxID=2036029 RepID=UPI00249C9942|nr:NAD(+) diphosphatase [Pontibacterium granulatum]MDI3326067.1 NAD(+) diphosphatase [Pontibacterium granulatum]